MHRSGWFWLFLPILLWAGERGRIVGRVYDAKTGEGLPGANVILEGLRMGAATDLDGSYEILHVPPGKYTLHFSMIGYRDVTVRNVRVEADRTTEINVAMEESAVQVEPVEVVAREPLIRKDVTSSRIIVNKEDLTDYPAENVTDVLRVKAGITTDPGGGLHVRGGRSGEVVYYIDGVPIQDPFFKGSLIAVTPQTVRQLELLAGSFNAEYGRAMSGVVNIITEEGARTFQANVQALGGDYLSGRSASLYPGLNRVSPLAYRDLSASLSGPLPGKLSYYLNVRTLHNDGYLYGIRKFLPWYRYPPLPRTLNAQGDGALVPMNPDDQVSVTGKLRLPLNRRTTFTYTVLYQNRRWQSYSHRFKYNPEANYHRDRFTLQHILNLQVLFGSSGLVSLKGGYTHSRYRVYVYEDPADTSILRIDTLQVVDTVWTVDPNTGDSIPQEQVQTYIDTVYRNLYRYPLYYYTSNIRFDSAGVPDYWHQRESWTWFGRVDVQQEVGPHQLKAGMEGSLYDLFYVSLNPYSFYFDPYYSDPTVPEHRLFRDAFTQHPWEASAYVQDKIELPGVILNLGVRLDAFDPKFKVPVDVRDPANQFPDRHPEGAYRSTTRKTQISPRLGVAFPYSETGVFHFSYGRFFQIPPLYYLYLNSEFEMEAKPNRTYVGNADLEPERTTALEVGFKQAIGDRWALELIAYAKDIRNLLGTELVPTYVQGDAYTRYINRDYASVKGVTLFLRYQVPQRWRASVDYTYQVAEGTNSYPRNLFADLRNGIEEPKFLVPLSWDERHRINGTVTYLFGQGGSITLTGFFGSGLPYTPTDEYGRRVGDENSARRPARWNVDLFSRIPLPVRNLHTALVLKVYNLLDRMNENYVYSSTGRATYTRSVFADVADPGWYDRPHYFSAPRRVELGMDVSF